MRDRAETSEKYAFPFEGCSRPIAFARRQPQSEGVFFGVRSREMGSATTARSAASENQSCRTTIASYAREHPNTGSGCRLLALRCCLDAPERAQ